MGFDIGGFELGLLPGADQADGVQTYWGVPDADAAMKHLLDAGAAPHTPVTDVGGGIRTALVRVPDAGLLGIIGNPHFKTPAA